MQSPKRRLSLLALPAAGLAIAILATIPGTRALGAPAEDEIDRSLQAFTKVFAAVEKDFADQVTPDKAIYNGAIPGMLRALDPHSRFFDPRSASLTRESQTGRYFGVGMSVGLRDGKITVLVPFGGSPAHRAGVRPGDTILQVGETAGPSLTIDNVSQLLRGQRGTSVQITLGRSGTALPIPVELTRQEIPQPTVPLAFFVRPGIAYVQIKTFGETTGTEVENRLKELGESDVKALVLDLRGNGGGLLNEGVSVANHFLNQGQVVVSHRGRQSSSRTYQTPRDGSGKDYPMVVLVDSDSASATEIVTGALQDHDRAWVIGQPTFGKGLVQSNFALGEDTMLWLTTAKYYTPSGRLIQRDYSHLSFLDYYSQAKAEQKNPNDAKMTDTGRTVYGGGGITPDEKFDVPAINAFQTEVRDRQYAFFSFAARYFGGREARLPAGWEPDDALMGQFHMYLEEKGARFTEAEFMENREWVKQELKREMYVTAFGYEESLRVAAGSDPAVRKAIDSLPRAVALLESSRKTLAARRNRERDIFTR